MRRATYHRLNRIIKLAIMVCLSGSLLWNVGGSTWGLSPWWPAVLFPLPGLLGWLGLRVYPTLVGRRAGPRSLRTYRLLYNAPAGWTDERARPALLNLIRAGTGLDIIWAREGGEVACWLAVAGNESLLERLVRDSFPEGRLEASPAPVPGQGVVIFRAQHPLPEPVEVCQYDGLDGLWFRWTGARTAVVAVWGPEARAVAQQWARPDELWSAQGQDLLQAPFAGDNPWPALPPFPATAAYPGLCAASDLTCLAPSLRVETAGPTLLLGHDAAQQPVGFAGPAWAGLRPLYVTGQATAQVVLDLVTQAVTSPQPVLLLDGQGGLTTRLARRLPGEVAAGRLLICDVERPAQSRFRLNPLWLPPAAPARAQALATGWPGWLQEQGVTAAGLGRTPYRTLQVAVRLMAWLAAQRQVPLDIPRLHATLRAPELLHQVDEATWAEVEGLDDTLRAWWLAEGRQLSRFDLNLHLAHLRDRLATLLALPEYEVLWRGPYLDPLAAVSAGHTLCWRLPDPRRRLHPYRSSQLLAIQSLLMGWPEAAPVLIVLHELEAGAWLNRLAALPQARLVMATERPVEPAVSPAALLVSRLAGEVPVWLADRLPDLRPTDLRRLPARRLLLQQGPALATVDLND